jgi:hypothetical protein
MMRHCWQQYKTGLQRKPARHEFSSEGDVQIVRFHERQRRVIQSMPAEGDPIRYGWIILMDSRCIFSLKRIQQRCH